MLKYGYMIITKCQLQPNFNFCIRESNTSCLWSSAWKQQDRQEYGVVSFWKKASRCCLTDRKNLSKKQTNLVFFKHWTTLTQLFGLKHITVAFYPDVQEQLLAKVTPSYSPLTCAIMAYRVYQRNGHSCTLRCLLFWIPMTTKNWCFISALNKTNFVSPLSIKGSETSHSFLKLPQCFLHIIKKEWWGAKARFLKCHYLWFSIKTRMHLGQIYILI